MTYQITRGGGLLVGGGADKHGSASRSQSTRQQAPVASTSSGNGFTRPQHRLHHKTQQDNRPRFNKPYNSNSWYKRNKYDAVKMEIECYSTSDSEHPKTSDGT